MCGRYASTKSSADLATLFDAIDETEGELAPDYNVAPTDPVPIVRLSARTPEPVLSVARWGLVPAWSVDTSGAARMINARAETVASSRAFGRPFAERRCLVPADGWYEWRRRPDGSRQAYFMTREDGESLVFAGIWSAWAPPDGAQLAGCAGVAGGDRVLTFSVLTMPAEAHLTRVHDRMPLVLEPIHWTDWLTTREPAGLLRPPSPEYAAGIELRPVSPAVGNVRNDGPELIRPVAEMEFESTVDSSNPTLF
jgi:putative SOS response-associated peptidase YedK